MAQLEHLILKVNNVIQSPALEIFGSYLRIEEANKKWLLVRYAILIFPGHVVARYSRLSIVIL